MDWWTFCTTILFGIGVILAYVFSMKGKGTGSYLSHPYWLGIPKGVVTMLTVFQCLAALGFLIAIGTWIIFPPIGGIASEGNLAWLVGLFIAFAIVWPIALRYEVHWLVIVSLVGTAAGSILLLAGALEEDIPRWWVILGLLLLNLVTVLCDGVGWNAVYIKGLMKPKELIA